MNALIVVILAGVGLAGVVVVVSAMLSLPVMLLWDWLMPLLFGLPEITWLQAWGILVLCGFLFKSSASTK